MGEGRGGGDAAEDRSAVKKEPSKGAYRRARIFRREMTEAEKRLWQVLRLRQTGGSRFRRQGRSVGSLPTSSVTPQD
jgi:very-short-patch-repair endonuclease